jgi:hypothetical protein
MDSATKPRVKRAGLMVAFILLALTAWSLRRSAGPKRLHLQVVDPAGTPVSGALLTPDGIRGTDRAHYGWRDGSTVKPTPVRTDAAGRATILYPAFVHERIRSIEISFGVDHPDFSPERPFIPVGSGITTATPPLQRLLLFLRDANLSGKIQSVTLHRAATVAVKASLAGKNLSAEKFYIQIVPESGMDLKRFTPAGETLFIHQVPGGNFQLRAVSFSDGRTYFSALTNGVAASIRTNDFALELEPALRVEGRLEGAPLPTRNGWVSVRVFNPPKKGSEPMIWADYTPVSENGEFVFSALPPGRLETVAICDGYVSQNPQGKPANIFVYPQRTDLPLEQELRIPMVPTGAIEIKVLDPAGKPVSDVDVSTWPNISWADYYSTGFASDFYRTSESLQSTNKFGRISKRRSA